MSDFYEDDHGVEFDIQDVMTWPVLVIATSPEAGRAYAEIVGIKNYISTNDITQTQGRRARSVVVTPEYLYEADKAGWEARRAYDGALQGWSFLPPEYLHRG